MSYDLNLWTVERVPNGALQELLPDAKLSDSHAELTGKGWLVAIDQAQRIEAEDIPDEIMAALPGIAWLIGVTIEPTGAPDSVKAKIRRTLKLLAKGFRGVVEDKQTDEVIPAGSKRYLPAPQEVDTRVATLNLNYWFTESPLRSRQGRERLIDYLTRHIPEVLPRRYGLCEPPSEKWAIGGKEAFLDFLDAHIDASMVVMYPSRPCADLTISPRNVGWMRRGNRQFFACGCLKLSFEFSALEDTGWRNTLEKAWLDIAAIAKPFATNVEIVDGWILRGRGRFWADGRTEMSVGSPTWFGIPRKLGLAFGLDGKFAEHWPLFKTHSSSTNGDLMHVSTPDWRERNDVSAIVGNTPEPIRERLGRGRSVRPDGATQYNAAPDGFPPVFFFPGPD